MEICNASNFSFYIFSPQECIVKLHIENSHGNPGAVIEISNLAWENIGICCIDSTFSISSRKYCVKLHVLNYTIVLL